MTTKDIDLTLRFLEAATNLDLSRLDKENLVKIWTVTTIPGGDIIHHNNPLFFPAESLGRPVRVIFFWKDGSTSAEDAWVEHCTLPTALVP